MPTPTPPPPPESRPTPSPDTAQSPFALLGLEARFALEPGAIERAYLARAASCHPDLAGSDPLQAAEAARLAAALNEAKAVLLNPETRARALLEQLGGKAGNDLPEGFLMEIMETRMAVEEAIARGESAALARWREWAGEQRRSYIERIGRLFAEAGAGGEGLASDTAPAVLDEIGRQLNAWRYIERMIEQFPD